MLDSKNLQFLSRSPCRPAVLLPHANLAEIGQSVDDLWPKKRFSRWRPQPSSILKISIFGHVTVTGSISDVVYQISSKSDNFSLRYGDFTIFKMAAIRHIGF